MKSAAIVAVILLALVVVFQTTLALGAPFGQAAWGGRHKGVLPARLRIASGVAALVIYPLIILTVLTSAGLADGDFLPGSGGRAMWVLAGLFALGGLANLVSRSPLERYWAPVSMGIAICCTFIARS